MCSIANENGGVFDMFDSVCKLSIAHSDCQSCQFGEFYIQWLLGGHAQCCIVPCRLRQTKPPPPLHRLKVKEGTVWYDSKVSMVSGVR